MDCVGEIKHIASCLCTFCGKVSIDKDKQVIVLRETNGREVHGLVSIYKYLARKSGNKDLLGRSPWDVAVVDQWLEYRTVQLDYCSQEKDVQNMLKELNSYLSDRVYLVGFYFTVADVAMYLGLYQIISELSFYDKQQYLHLSRWFDQVQHTKGVQQNLKKVFFQKNLLYSKASSH